jgi:phosphatidate cytidylyltransferase
MLVARLLSAAVGIPLVLAAIWLAPWWGFAAVILLLSLRSQWEFYALFRPLGVAAFRGAGLAGGAVVVVAFAAGQAHPWRVPLALTLAVCGVLLVGLLPWSEHVDWSALALTLQGVCYCAWLLGHAIWLRDGAAGAGLLTLMLAVTWCGEAAAYFVGRAFGRHRLAPRVSPGKTIEGAAAQLLVSIAVAAAGGSMLGLPQGHAITLGAMLGVVGQVGDLAESWWKRCAGVKDAGAILPGHGGLLDRLDSLLFNIPALYYYWRLFIEPLRG